jgi:alkylhydroperoxidase/carboxymuconolactone decarboxylase family protein YurZ
MLQTVYKGLYEETVKSPTKDASADYWLMVQREKDYVEIFANKQGCFYGQIMSFDEIIKGKDTSLIVVSSLIGLDCPWQLANQMRGMMLNGATREEVELVRQICLRICDKLGVDFKNEVCHPPESI